MSLLPLYTPVSNLLFKSRSAIISFLVGIFFFTIGASFLSMVAISFSSYILFLFIKKLGNTIPIIELMVVLISLQWLIGPTFSYSGFSKHEKYYMYITELEYMPFALMGVLAFFSGTAILRKKKEQYLKGLYIEKIKNHLKNNSEIAYGLIFIGWGCSIVQHFMPGSLNFIFYLLANSMYIGVIYLLFQPSNTKWWLTGTIMFLLFLSSLQSSMFHGLLLWLTFISLYFFVIKKYDFQRKLMYIILGIGFAYIIQIAKWEIRNGNVTGNLSGFVTVVNDKVLGSDDFEDAETPFDDFVVRLNQGWIISRIIYYIPAEAPFVDGKTVIDAITSTLLPRFINPGKTVVGGKEYFERFTGFELLYSTSMGASLLGEGYANFGFYGAIVFLFFVGLLYRFVLNTIYKIADKYPTVILWIPLIFLQVVKAESDLLRVLNHLVKASLLVFLIYWVCYKVFRWKI